MSLTPQSPDFNLELFAAIRRCAPLLSSSVTETDVSYYRSVLRELYAEDPVRFGEHFDLFLDGADDISEEMKTQISYVVGREVFDMPFEIRSEDGSLTTLFALGVLPYGYDPVELRTNDLTEAQCAELRNLLYKHYFDDANCTVRIVPHFLSVSSTLMTDDASFFTILKRAAKAPGNGASCGAGLEYLLSDRDMYPDLYGTALTHPRIIAFTVKSHPGKPAQKQAPTHQGLCFRHPIRTADDICLTHLLSTEWGTDMCAWLRSVEGQSMRYFTAEPSLITDAIQNVDLQLGAQRVLIEATRFATVSGLTDPTKLLVSFGVFQDPQIGYAELRAGFALAERPDEILSGTEITLPLEGLEEAVEALLHFFAAAVPFCGVSVPDVSTYMLRRAHTAEPESTPRLYCTSKGKLVTIAGENNIAAEYEAPGPNCVFN